MRIVNNADLEVFVHSPTYGKLIGFIEKLADAAAGKPLESHEDVATGVLKKVAEAVKMYPTHEQNSRFGKPEFKDFYDYVEKQSPLWLEEIGVSDPQVARYFCESWGNRSRIDYGSGHELNFICFLVCLFDLGILTNYEHTVLSTFNAYFTTMRLVQAEYWLEPAGSHGVWGLDDYHFLPYLFGSSQLVGHKFLRPLSIHDEDLVEMYAKDNYYFACIKFINSVKTASLRWHSPMLDDISAAKSWLKVSQGMVKMYKAEVLGKLPIMQHFIFSSFLPAPDGISADNAPLEHTHGWGDCCGIKVPSAIAGAQQQGRVLPFD